MFSFTDFSSPSSPYPVTNNSNEQVLKGLKFHFVYQFESYSKTQIL